MLSHNFLARHWARDWRALALTQVHHGSRLSDSREDGEALTARILQQNSLAQHWARDWRALALTQAGTPREKEEFPGAIACMDMYEYNGQGRHGSHPHKVKRELGLKIYLSSLFSLTR